MEGRKVRKIALVVALVIVIVAAFAIVVKRLTVEEKRALLPDRMLNQRMTLMSVKPPYATVTKTVTEWQQLGQDDAGYYRNPDTREFTMVPSVVCGRCGKRIPGPAYPLSLNSKSRNAKIDAMHKIEAAYKCPLCGQLAYPLRRPAGPARGKKAATAQ